MGITSALIVQLYPYKWARGLRKPFLQKILQPIYKSGDQSEALRTKGNSTGRTKGKEALSRCTVTYIGKADDVHWNAIDHKAEQSPSTLSFV